MKRTLSLVILAVLTLSLSAVPARRKPFQGTLTDGSPVTVRLIGDEILHYYIDAEGRELERLDDGRFAPVTNPWRAAARRAAANERRNEVHARRIQRAVNARKAGTFTGSKRGLVILINYSDVQIQDGHTKAVFDAMFNQQGFSLFDHIGSVRDYFKAQSYGEFEIDFDIVGPYTLSHEVRYYGENDSQGNDRRVGAMVAEAVRLADDDVDYKTYDWDGDGAVDQVYVIYAGYGEAMGAPSYTIWPLEWYLSSSDYGRTILLDGVMIDQFACSCELEGTKSTQLAGIGTACHEFSHCLGLPDFYNTEGGTTFGFEEWSLMDYGSYNGTYDDEGYPMGNIPAGYTSFERMSCGWLKPTELGEGNTVTGMKALTDSPEAYIIYNDAHPDEYYLLENRQLTSWDQALPGHGMLVLHVDYDAKVWEDNTVNNDPNRRRCTIIPADDSYFDTTGYASFQDLAGDPYPGTSHNTSLTDDSKPAATLYNAANDGRKLMGKPIEEIKEADGLISFLFMGGDAGTLRTPVAEAATDVKEHSFTARWTKVDGAEAYTLELTSGDAEPILHTGISGNSIALNGLDSTVVHSYRVKATATGRESNWSNTVTVRLKGFGEWTDWEPYGNGTAVYNYSKNGIYGDNKDTYTITTRTSNADPTRCQFMLDGWGDDVPFIIDCDLLTGRCSVAQQYIGYTDTYYGCGKVYVADEVYYQNTVLGRSTTWEAYPSCYDAAKGKFTLYLAYYDLVDIYSNWGECVETVVVNGTDFKDYSIELKMGAQHDEAGGMATQDFTIIPGSSVASWRYALLEGTPESVEAVADVARGITAGAIASTTGSGKQTCSVSVTGGTYYVVVVSYDNEGVMQQFDYDTFSYSSSADWVVLGNARYTDDVLCTLFEGFGKVTYDVEVQEHAHVPGLFRMKNPYSTAHPYNDPSEILDGDFYIEIDATEPHLVTIAPQAMGVDWGYGECSMYSAEGRYGNFENSVITFSKAGDIYLVMGDTPYRSNAGGGFRLDLSTTGFQSPLLQEKEAETISLFYDLQGRPVEEPQQGGLYIRNGRKVIVK